MGWLGGSSVTWSHSGGYIQLAGLVQHWAPLELQVRCLDVLLLASWLAWASLQHCVVKEAFQPGMSRSMERGTVSSLKAWHWSHTSSLLLHPCNRFKSEGQCRFKERFVSFMSGKLRLQQVYRMELLL